MLTARLAELKRADPTVKKALTSFIKYGISPAQFGRVLMRNADADLARTNEGALLLGVITTAYADAHQQFGTAVRYGGKFNWQQVDAARFFFDRRLDFYAGYIGLDPEFAREVLRAATPWARNAGALTYERRDDEMLEAA